MRLELSGVDKRQATSPLLATQVFYVCLTFTLGNTSFLLCNLAVVLGSDLDLETRVRNDDYSTENEAARKQEKCEVSKGNSILCSSRK